MMWHKGGIKYPRWLLHRGYLYPILLNLILAAIVIPGTGILITYCRGKTQGHSSVRDSKDSRALEIWGTDSGRLFGRWPLEENEEFAVEFIHSVNQSPVREIFKAKGTEILPQALRFSSFGAGMPSDLDEGQSFSLDGETMVITGYTTSFRELNYIVGTVSDHLLHINGETISLRNLCGKNAQITLQVQ